MVRELAQGARILLAANRQECEALAAFNDLVEVASFEVDFQLKPSGKHGVKVVAELKAQITQTCGLTLDPFEALVTDAFEAMFVPKEEIETQLSHLPDGYDHFEADVPDAIEHGAIDLGAVASEHFTLALDLYPRKPGATMPPS